MEVCYNAQAMRKMCFDEVYGRMLQKIDGFWQRVGKHQDEGQGSVYTHETLHGCSFFYLCRAYLSTFFLLLKVTLEGPLYKGGIPVATSPEIS